nr:uncharacterized protein LOC121470864 [Taeniopygia guttata]
MAERGRGIGRRARRSAAGRPGGGCAPRGGARRGRGDAGTRRERGAPRAECGGHARAEGGRALRGRGRGGGGKQRRACAGLWGNLEIRARRAFGLVVWFEVGGTGMPQCVLGVACAGQRGASPRCESGPARSAAGPPPAPRRFGGNRLPRPAFARFGLIFNTCPFIYNLGCSDSSPVSAPIYACTPFSFPFPKGQPKHSPREGESYSAGLGFVCLNIELEKIPSLCGLINNKSDRFAFPINDTGKLSS